MAKLYVGLSGYSYKEWQGEGRFYPPEMKQTQFLEYYVSRYNALEADGTWYQMPHPTSVGKWVNVSPEVFKVSPKMHRDVTHKARMKPEGTESLKVFVKKLEPLEKAGKLGPILVQLPPNLKRDNKRLGFFLSELPRRDTLKWCLEFRNETWHVPEVEEMLRENSIGWVAADTDDANAQRRDTSDHIYARLRKTDYPEELLQNWATYFRSKLDAGKDCYVYCKHEDAEAPWIWADRLIELVS